MQRGVKRTRSLTVWTTGILMAGLLALQACDGGSDGSAGATAPPAVPEVTVAHPRAQMLVEWTEFTGRFEAVEWVDVRARVSGHLRAVDFRDAQFVEKGQLLFLIDPRPFEVALDRARADLASAQAQLDLADLEFTRVANLSNSPAFSRASYDQRVQEKRAAEATLASARAAVADARLDLEYTRIHAPVSGRISDRRADVGNLVTEETLLTTIVSQNPIYFTFDTSEADFLALSAGGALGPAALDPRALDPGQRQAGRRGRLEPPGADGLSRQRGRPGLGHDSGAPNSSIPTG